MLPNEDVIRQIARKVLNDEEYDAFKSLLSMLNSRNSYARRFAESKLIEYADILNDKIDEYTEKLAN